MPGRLYAELGTGLSVAAGWESRSPSEVESDDQAINPARGGEVPPAKIKDAVPIAPQPLDETQSLERRCRCEGEGVSMPIGRAAGGLRARGRLGRVSATTQQCRRLAYRRLPLPLTLGTSPSASPHAPRDQAREAMSAMRGGEGLAWQVKAETTRQCCRIGWRASAPFASPAEAPDLLGRAEPGSCPEPW